MANVGILNVKCHVILKMLYTFWHVIDAMEYKHILEKQLTYAFALINIYRHVEPVMEQTSSTDTYSIALGLKN